MNGGNERERRQGGSPGPDRPISMGVQKVCVGCRREEKVYRRLEEVTAEMANEEYPNVDIEVAWETIYRRMERGIGWLIMSVGLIILLGFGAWQMLNEFFLDPEVPFLVRFGTGAAIAGAIVLLISIGREVTTKYRSERYREVQR